MPNFSNFKDAIEYSKGRLRNFGYEVKSEKWQGKELTNPMWETLNVSWSCQIDEVINELVDQIKPNLPWANEHFKERIGGLPLNPPPSHKIWPFAQKDNKEHTIDEKFDHTYPERFWPKRAGNYFDELHYPPDKTGIRFAYGDLQDMIELLGKEPLTRQAYLPIFFPEDTGSKGGNGRVPCTLGYHFIMRNGYLHMVYYIRSCDFFRHYRDDIYLAARLLIWVLEEVKKYEVATTESGFERWKDVRPGSLTMHITSLHCFKQEVNLLNK